MPPQFHWALSSFNAGDGHQINPKVPERPATLDYLAKVNRAAEDAGFVNILVPTGTRCADGWAAAAAISTMTRKIKFLVALRPGIVGPGGWWWERLRPGRIDDYERPIFSRSCP